MFTKKNSNQPLQLPIDDLKTKLEPFKIQQIELKYIKVFNYLKFYQDSYKKFFEKYFLTQKEDINDFDNFNFEILNSNVINSLKTEALTNENRQHRAFFFLAILTWISKFTFTNESLQDYINSDVVLNSLNFLVSNFYSNLKIAQNEKEHFLRTILDIVLKFLSHLVKNHVEFFKNFLPNLKDKVEKFFNEIYSKDNYFSSINLLFSDDIFIELRLDLLEILIEISFIHQEVRDFSKLFYSYKRNLEMSHTNLKKKFESKSFKKLENEERNTIKSELVLVEDEMKKLESSETNIILKDKEIIIYVRII